MRVGWYLNQMGDLLYPRQRLMVGEAGGGGGGRSVMPLRGETFVVRPGCNSPKGNS